MHIVRVINRNSLVLFIQKYQTIGTAHDLSVHLKLKLIRGGNLNISVQLIDMIIIGNVDFIFEKEKSKSSYVSDVKCINHCCSIVS